MSRAFSKTGFSHSGFDVEFWDGATQQAESWTAKAKQAETWTAKTIQAESWTVDPVTKPF